MTFLSTFSAMLLAWVPRTQMPSNGEATWDLFFQLQHAPVKAPRMKCPPSQVTTLLGSGCDSPLLLVQAASSAVFINWDTPHPQEEDPLGLNRLLPPS